MKIDKELEIGFIRAIQKHSNERTEKEEKAIDNRNEYINSQFKWSTKLDEKLVLINDTLREEEKKVFNQYRKIEEQCKLMVANKEIEDLNIKVESEYWNNKHYKKYDPKVYGNPFYINTWDDFVGFRQLEEEYDNSCSNTVSEMLFIPQDSLIAKANHCYSFHHLYDHTNLTWFDIYNIDEVWMEIKVDYQFFSKIKRIKT
ncbi:hypothetical protein ACM55F_04925 [Flavobacterium sp. XS2P12]|uniref:hypothetical protein n=1 Tax=Flavobacterium melibiosi TaxID=3398734 RepID=UPI003A88F4C0